MQQKQKQCTKLWTPSKSKLMNKERKKEKTTDWTKCAKLKQTHLFNQVVQAVNKTRKDLEKTQLTNNTSTKLTENKQQTSTKKKQQPKKNKQAKTTQNKTKQQSSKQPSPPKKMLSFFNTHLWRRSELYAQRGCLIWLGPQSMKCRWFRLFFFFSFFFCLTFI